ncbi:CTP synthase [bacterium]|nr:MAG: CTP synthase [bacterium]
MEFTNLNISPIIFVSGGVISGIGKGVATASLAYLLQEYGQKVSIIKFENYLNIDSGTINPIEHGDPFLTEDGTESDMDLGTYERFLGKKMTRNNFVTMGQMYKAIIDRERNFGYKGETVEPLYALRAEVLERFRIVQETESPDIILAELGGTVGEFQNTIYYETMKLLKFKYDHTILNIHVSYMPYLESVGEIKSKPVQQSVQMMDKLSMHPDFLIVRTDRKIDSLRIRKVASSCNISEDRVIEGPNVSSIYKVPINFEKAHFAEKVLDKLNIKYDKKIDPCKKIKKLQDDIEKTSASAKEVTLAIVGKYFSSDNYQLPDSYAALLEALKHASYKLKIKIDFKFINSEDMEEITGVLDGVSGIIVPIGWGSRGVEGKIRSIQYARENKVPYLGLCYGMQLACVEWARNVLDIKDAASEEVNAKSKNLVIHQIPIDEKYVRIKGDGVTMRLGSYPCVLKSRSLASEIYGKNEIEERHRHRFEFNNKYRDEFEKSGFVFSGTSPDNFFVEFIELPKEVHPFFIATQAHPEYKSTPWSPHPIFLRFLEESLKQDKGKILN